MFPQFEFLVAFCFLLFLLRGLPKLTQPLENLLKLFTQFHQPTLALLFYLPILTLLPSLHFLFQQLVINPSLLNSQINFHPHFLFQIHLQVTFRFPLHVSDFRSQAKDQYLVIPL